MTSPRTLLAFSGLNPKKQYGQNFLAESATARMIVDRAGLMADEVVVEIGPGLGALTLPAAGCARRVIAVEKDPAMAGVLAVELARRGIANVDIRRQDILAADWAELRRDAGRPLVVLGNLPYNISSQIVIALIRARADIDRAVLMFQREVARRLAVGPGSKEYGRLSVMLQYCAEVKKVAVIKPHQFLPRPKVASEVIEIRFRETINAPALDEEMLSAVVKAAFSTRRKTLKNALAHLEMRAAAHNDGVDKALILAGIEPSRRAETLSVAEFVRLANIFTEIRP